MAEDEVIVPVRGCAVLRRVNFLIGTVDADAEDPDEDTPSVGDIAERGFWDVPEMD